MSQMLRVLICIVFIVAVSVLGGCATLFRGSTDKVNFSSDPTTAKVYVNGQYMGQTPFELKLQSWKERGQVCC